MNFRRLLALLAFSLALPMALPGAARARTPEEAQVDMFQAEGLLVARQYQAAYDRYLLLHAEFPALARVSEGYIRTLIPLRKWDELRTAILAERKVQNSGVLYAREMVSALRGTARLDEALEEDLVWIVAHPEDAMMANLADSLLMDTNFSPTSLKALHQMVEQAPQSVNLRVLEVRSLGRAGKHAGARAAAVDMDRALKLGGRATLELAKQQDQQNERPEAVRTAELAMKEFSGTAPGMDARLARDAWLRGTPRWPEARDDLRALARERAGQIPGVRAQLLIAEGEMDQNPAAARALAETLAVKYPMAAGDARRVVGESHFKERHFEEAAAAFNAAAMADPDVDRKREDLWNRAECHFFANDWDSANTAYKLVVLSGATPAASSDALARMLLIGDASEDAEPALKAFAEAAYLATLQPARADSFYRVVERGYPRSVPAFEATFQRAELRRQAGDAAGALGIYLTFADSSITHARAPEALFQAAELCRTKLAQPRHALDLYAEVAARFPESWRAPDARKWVEKLRRETGS